MIPSEYHNTTSVFPDKHRTQALIVLCLTLFMAPLASPATLFAAGKQSLTQALHDADKNSIADHIALSTEQIIEEMVMQIDLGPTELRDNPNPTSLASSIPNIKPLHGTITSEFGMRVHPIYGIPLFHQGIDIAAVTGTKVQTTGDGMVAYAGTSKGYGNVIAINHGYGYKTIYAHLSKLLVHQGQKVTRGQRIALSGNSGASTGAHVHYEVHKNSEKVNPMVYFFHDTNPDTFITTKESADALLDNNS